MQYMRGPFSFIVKIVPKVIYLYLLQNIGSGNLITDTVSCIKTFRALHTRVLPGHLRKKVIASALPIFIHKGCIFSLITNLGEQISITG